MSKALLFLASTSTFTDTFPKLLTAPQVEIQFPVGNPVAFGFPSVVTFTVVPFNP